MSYRILRAVQFAARRSFKSGRKLHKATRPVVAEMLEQRTLLSITAASLVSETLITGAQATYLSTSPSDSTTLTDTVTVVGPSTAPTGQNATEFSDTRVTTTGSSSTTVTGQAWYGLTGSGYVEFADQLITSVATYKSSYPPSLVILPATMVAGQQYSSSYADMWVNQYTSGSTSGETDHTRTITLNSETTQSITVPAGTFDCYEITVVDVSTASGSTTSSTNTTQNYYALGIGDIEDVSDDGTTVLTSYHVPAPSALTWTGGGDGINWSDPKNWNEDAAPSNGDSLIFPTGSPLTSNNDMAGLSINTIDLQGSGYTLTGNSISLTGGLTSETGNNTYNINTTLVGSPTLDDQTGDLDIQSVLSGGGLTLAGDGIFTFDQADTYTGPTTLSAGVTIDDNVLTDAFGSSDITIGAGSAPVTIDDTASSADTLDNNITFQPGAILAVDPAVDFSGTITLDGGNTIEPLGPEDTIEFSGPFGGSGTLTVIGQGTAQISGSFAATDFLAVTGGRLQLSGALKSTSTTIPQVVVVGGTLELLSDTSGTGNIDIQSGTLVTDESAGATGCANYRGKVSWESGGTLKDYDAIDAWGFGRGTLDLEGGILQNSVTSTDPSAATTIGNAIKVDGNVQIISQGSTLDFSGVMTVDGSYTMTVNGEASFIVSSTLQGDATAETSVLTFTGPGKVGIYGTVTDMGVSLETDNSGGIRDELNCALINDSNITVNGPQTVVEMFYVMSGDGDLDVTQGTLVSEETPGMGGATGYKGTVTLGAGGTLKDYDATDAWGFGKGTLDLKGGLLQNSSGGLAIIGNPVTVEGSVTFSSRGQRLKLSQSLTVAATGKLDVIGTLALTGSLAGSGSIVLDGDELDVAGSNSGFSGNVTVNSGMVEVAADHALGIGPLIADLAAAGVLETVSTIGDPILDNPLTVEAGTLTLQGQLTFPNGITIDSGATLDIEGAASQIVVSGPLAGGGNLLIGGGVFSDPGGSASFTGGVGFQGGQATPNLTVSDAGGIYNGSPFPATALLSAPGVTPTGSLEGVSPTLTYYSGGISSSTAPTNPGSYTVVASFSGSTHYTAVTTNAVPFVITPATAAKLVFTTGPAAGTAGSKLASVAVSIETAGNTVVTSDNASVTLTIASGPGSFASGSTTTVAAVNGVATFSNLILDTAGNYVLSAADSTDSLSGFASTSFNVAPAAATHFALSAPSAATAGAAFNFTVTALDQFGNTATGYTSTVHFTSSDGAATLPANATLNKGIGTFSATLNTAGNQTITATDTVTNSMTGVSGTIAVGAASTAEKLVFFIQPSNGRAGALNPLIVLVENAKGQVVLSDHSQVTLGVASGPGVLGGTVTVKACLGVALFTNLSLTKAGVYTLKATDGSDTIAISRAFTVTAAAPSKLVFAQQPGNAVAGGTISPVLVDVEDKFGNIVTGDSSVVTLSLAGCANAKLNGTVSERAVSGVATFSNLSLNVAGAYQLRATDGCLAGAASSNFAISPGAATHAAFLVLPTSAKHGKAFTVEVVMLDKYNNVASNDASKVTLSLATHPKNATLAGTLTAAVVNGIATFNNLVVSLAGSYSLTAADNNGLSSITSSLFNVA